MHHHAIVRPNACGRIECAQESVQHCIPVIAHTHPVRVALIDQRVRTGRRPAQGVHIRPCHPWWKAAEVGGAAVGMKPRVMVNRRSGNPVANRAGTPEAGCGVAVRCKNVRYQGTKS